jgi:hypothetical protein
MDGDDEIVRDEFAPGERRCSYSPNRFKGEDKYVVQHFDLADTEP